MESLVRAGESPPGCPTTNTATNNSPWPRPWIEAIGGPHHLVVEAGTGVGKSFAYLVPAILATAGQRRTSDEAPAAAWLFPRIPSACKSN